MQKSKPSLQTIKNIFYILMVAILGWFLCMQLFGANEQDYNTQPESTIYSGTFYWKKADGSKQKIDIPGTYDVKPGQTMVITTTLPKNYDETSLAIRSSLQDVKFYIGNKLRTQYSTKSTRMAGKNSASRYIFCPTSYKDAGKQLRIELTTYTSTIQALSMKCIVEIKWISGNSYTINMVSLLILPSLYYLPASHPFYLGLP